MKYYKIHIQNMAVTDILCKWQMMKATTKSLDDKALHLTGEQYNMTVIIFKQSTSKITT